MDKVLAILFVIFVVATTFGAATAGERTRTVFITGSSHTGNLRHNSAIGLLLLDEAGGASPFARRRASLHGNAHPVERGQPLFAAVMREFHQRFGKIMETIEPLPDFQLFRVEVHGGSFVRGFGQAYRLDGELLDRLEAVDPRR